MSLTYQPFADAPDVQKIEDDLKMNVGDDERIMSAAAGATLAVSGLALARGGLGRWMMLGLGAALIYRAWSGRCALYEYQGIDKRHGSRARGHSGTKVEQAVEIDCPADALYRYWRKLSELPKVMRHVESVAELPNNRSHWKVRTRTGVPLEWDAVFINDEAGRMIAWQSVPGSTIRNAGSVWFEQASSGATRVKVAMEFDPPAGKLGVTLAHLLGGSPEAELREDLLRFKEFAERELRGQSS
jgi:uncharacterized membrane protein